MFPSENLNRFQNQRKRADYGTISWKYCWYDATAYNSQKKNAKIDLFSLLWYQEASFDWKLHGVIFPMTVAFTSKNFTILVGIWKFIFPKKGKAKMHNRSIKSAIKDISFHWYHNKKTKKVLTWVLLKVWRILFGGSLIDQSLTSK